MRPTADTVLARDAALFATNDGAFYARRAVPVMDALAKRMAAYTYDANKALKAWRYAADDAATIYVREFYAKGSRMTDHVNAATREFIAEELATYYDEQIADRTRIAEANLRNRRMWTLPNIANANADAGEFFFSRETMRFFNDTRASFAIRYNGAAIFVERVKTSPLFMLPLGSLREFNPATGRISCPLNDAGVAEVVERCNRIAATTLPA